MMHLFEVMHALKKRDLCKNSTHPRYIPSQISFCIKIGQGAALHDVTIRLAADTSAGVAGGNGGGGSFVGVTVIGGKYGIDVRQAQGSMGAESCT